MANIRHRYRYTKAQTGVVLLLALVLSGAPSWPAWAQPGASEDDRNKKVEQLSAEGAKLFKAGKYPEAIDRFEKAYAIIPVANLLYNIAFAYDRTGDIEKAVAYYERFILAKDADPEIRSRALNRITEIREELAKLDAIKDNAGSGSTGNPNPTPKQEEGLSSMATTGI
ncbi:MAG: tetratricopeptide repeat protein, partial [Myxococcota bacterium]